jgi:steroid delta-isomerase-like uncharacterized protein
MTDGQIDGRTLAARYLSGLNDHDPDAVDGFVAVDYINHNPFVEDGREANRAFWSSFFTAFPDIKATMDDLVVAGDRVVGRFTYRGTHAGPFYGMPATGNSIEMRSIDIWRTENGEFVEHWDELNLLDLFQQIGMIPPFELGDTESTT